MIEAGAGGEFDPHGGHGRRYALTYGLVTVVMLIAASVTDELVRRWWVVVLWILAYLLVMRFVVMPMSPIWRAKRRGTTGHGGVGVGWTRTGGARHRGRLNFFIAGVFGVAAIAALVGAVQEQSVIRYIAAACFFLSAAVCSVLALRGTEFITTDRDDAG